MNQLHDDLRALRTAADEELRHRWDRSLPFADALFDRWERADQLGFGEGASGCDGVTVLHPTPGVEWSYQSYVIVLDGGIDRNRVIELMAEASIETTIGTYACHQHPAYEPWSAGTTFPNSAQHAERALTLPLVPRMEEHQVERVVESLDTAIYQV